MAYLITLAIVAVPLISGMLAFRFYTEKEKPYVFFCTAVITSIFGAFCVIGAQTNTFAAVPWLGYLVMVTFALAAVTIPIIMQLQRMESLVEDFLEELAVEPEPEGEGEETSEPQEKRKTNIWSRET